jgi:hypothetical protein
MWRAGVLSIAVLLPGCGSATAPSEPVASNLSFTATAPASGSTVVVPAAYPYIIPGGVVLPAGSGLISVGVSMTSGREVPWAQLRVYLLTGGTQSEYCGLSDPDSPTWRSLPSGWKSSYTVTGFRVYRLPCDVTGLRAMLHTRDTGLLTPPAPHETVAEATLAVNLHLRRQ